MQHMMAVRALARFQHYRDLNVGAGGAGIRFSRRQTSTERYFVSRRSIPAWAMALSLLAMLISSVTFIRNQARPMHRTGRTKAPGVTVIPVPCITAVVVIPLFCPVEGVGAYECLGKRFGYPALVYSSIGYAPGHFSKMGFVFYLLRDYIPHFYSADQT